MPADKDAKLPPRKQPEAARDLRAARKPVESANAPTPHEKQFKESQQPEKFAKKEMAQQEKTKAREIDKARLAARKQNNLPHGGKAAAGLPSPGLKAMAGLGKTAGLKGIKSSLMGKSASPMSSMGDTGMAGAMIKKVIKKIVLIVCFKCCFLALIFLLPILVFAFTILVLGKATGLL